MRWEQRVAEGKVHPNIFHSARVRAHHDALRMKKKLMFEFCGRQIIISGLFGQMLETPVSAAVSQPADTNVWDGSRSEELSRFEKGG